MEIVLLVSDDCTPCRAAEQLWSSLCAEMGLTLRIVGTEHTEGSEIAHRLEVNSVPVLVVDGRVVSVGVPQQSAARALLEGELASD